jgi:predicted nucleotidyltransferase
MIDMLNNESINISDKVDNKFDLLLPETYDIITNSNLTIHPSVYAVVLSGSRIVKNHYRMDSDIDLSFIVETNCVDHEELGQLLNSVLEVSIRNWLSPIEIDTAAIYDKQKCELKCFYSHSGDINCSLYKKDCFGIYKIQKEFTGFVPNIGIDIKMAYPMIVIWQR